MSVVIRLLGPVDVMVAGEVRPVPGLRRKAVLARLALRPGDAVGVDRLIDAVWDGSPPATAVNSLQSHVSYLRRLLGAAESVVARPPGYALSVPQTDLRLAEELVERGRGPGEPAERLTALERALALWRGRSLADVAGLSWFEREAERLERMRRSAEHAALECRLTLGRHAELVPELEELTGRHPFDEDLHGQLMVALYRSGRQADALAVFRRLRARLREELGIDPSGPLRDLEAAVLRQDPGLDPVPAPVAPSGGGGTVLVERAEETGLIERTLDGVLRDGEGRVLVFEGPAGIGKTSVLDHARKRAAAVGFTVLTARSTDLETDYAWGCVRQLFQRRAEADEILSAGAGEYAIIDALYRLTGSLASRHPLLIGIDDLHWADAASVQFLAYLATRLDGLRAVLVIGTRPGQEHLGRIVAAISGLPHTTARELRPLTRAGCARLLALLTDAGPDAEPDPGLVDRYHALTRGNPFLLRELAQAGGDPEGSPSVARYVARQLRYLPPASVAAARVLAVLGDEAGGGLVAQVAGTSPQQALDALAPLVTGRLVTADGVPVRFSFGHPLIRTAVYDAIPAAERTELHLRAARVHAHDPIRAATHLVRVPPGLGSPDPVPVLSEAADASLARGSVDGAVAFLRRALEEDLGDRRAGMLTRLGTAESLVDAPRGIEHLAEALALEPDPDKRAQVSFSLATVLWLTCRPREAARVCQASLERDRAASADARLALQACVAMVSYGTRNGSDLIALIDDYAARPVDTSTLGGLMLESSLALHDMHQNRRRSAERRALNVLEGDRLIGIPAGETVLTCSFYALRASDTPRVMASIDTLLDHSRRSGSLRGLTPALYFRAEYLYAQGRPAESVAHSRQAWEISAYATIGLGEIFGAGVYMKALVATGQLREAASVLGQVKAVQAVGMTPTLYAPGEIAVHLGRGDVRRGFEVALAMRDDCRAFPVVNPLVSDWRAPLVQCLVSLGRTEEARDVAAELLDVATVWDTPRAIGRALRFAALAESGPRRLEMLAESVRLLESTQANLERARSLYLFGDALRRAGRVEEARARLTDALELADFCGAGPLRAAIDAVLGGTPARG